MECLAHAVRNAYPVMGISGFHIDPSPVGAASPIHPLATTPEDAIGHVVNGYIVLPFPLSSAVWRTRKCNVAPLLSLARSRRPQPTRARLRLGR
jgi:hypothetical protein